MPDINTDYLDTQPNTGDIREMLSSTVEYWKDRNTVITDLRDMILGNNKISAPTSTQYKIRTLHTYLLASTFNEKVSRYTQQPLIQAIPSDITDDARHDSTELEKALEVAFYEMERKGDGDVWSRVALDAVMLDAGVERIERAPAAFWPELSHYESKDLGMEYKKEQGLPMRTVYVPLESFYPIYEGPTLVESFEIETRSLRSVYRNKSFSTDKLKEMAPPADMTGGLDTQVTILHYSNMEWHAYYALAPSSNSNWPQADVLNKTNIGEPVLLSAYKHGIGQSIYNVVAGRFGGWKGNNNRIEGVNKGLMELNQAADEIISQAFTNVRAKYWPTMLHKINPELRPPVAGGGPPNAVRVPEGQDMVLFNDESLEPLFKAQDDPAVPWLLGQIQNQMGRLGGSPVLFGDSGPGVETGYHQSLQITQAEHLDEKIEQHLSQGAIQRATIVLSHVKASGQKVPVHYVETGNDGKKRGKYLILDPDKLSPMPRFDALVRKPRPVDFAAALRSAREASDERQGKGPLLSDDTIRESILNINSPDEEKLKILIEKQKNSLVESGVLSERIAEALNLKLAQEGTPDISPEVASSADPAVLQAMDNLKRNAAAVQAGVSPQIAEQAGGVPLATGQPVGQSQPEQAVGQEIAKVT